MLTGEFQDLEAGDETDLSDTNAVRGRHSGLGGDVPSLKHTSHVGGDVLSPAEKVVESLARRDLLFSTCRRSCLTISASHLPRGKEPACAVLAFSRQFL